MQLNKWPGITVCCQLRVFLCYPTSLSAQQQADSSSKARAESLKTDVQAILAGLQDTDQNQRQLPPTKRCCMNQWNKVNSTHSTADVHS